MNGGGSTTKGNNKGGNTLNASHSIKRAVKPQAKENNKVITKKKAGSESPSEDNSRTTTTKYFITGKRILEPVTKQLTQGLSPSSSTLLAVSDDEASGSGGRKRANSILGSDGRPKTPVTVVGYTDGYPKGLHIVGNKSPQALTITAPKDWSSNPEHHHQHGSLFSSERNDTTTGGVSSQKPWTDLIEEGLNAGKAPSEVLKRLPDSPRTQISKNLTHASLTQTSQKTGGAAGQAAGSSRQAEMVKPRTPLTGPVAPWRDLSAFTSPHEQRRQAFNSFRLTSPDPPKTPMKVASRQGLNPVAQITTTFHPRPHGNKYYDPYSSAPAFSTTTGPNRELAFLTTSSVAAAIIQQKATTSNNKRKKQGGGGGGSLVGKSVTGLSINARVNEEMFRIKKTPSQTSTPPGRLIKRPVTQDMKTRDHNNYLTTPQQPPTPNNRFGSVLQTSPMITAKRMPEIQTRNILTPGYNAHSQATARVEARERYSNPIHPTTQKLTPVTPRVNVGGSSALNPTGTGTSSVPPTINTTTVGPQANNLTGKQVKAKPQLLPPVHVPGPKRENIYIGQYDGSDDSDSDTDLPQKNSSKPDHSAEKPTSS